MRPSSLSYLSYNDWQTTIDTRNNALKKLIIIKANVFELPMTPILGHHSNNEIVLNYRNRFYQNVSTLRNVRVFAIANPSVCRLSSVKFVRRAQFSTIYLCHFVP